MAETQLPLQEAVKAFDRQAVRQAIEVAEAERRQLVERFPLAEWPSMPLERYALGQDDNKQDTFCWWMEWGTAHVGSMRGGFRVGADERRRRMLSTRRRPSEGSDLLAAVDDQAVDQQDDDRSADGQQPGLDREEVLQGSVEQHAPEPASG